MLGSKQGKQIKIALITGAGGGIGFAATELFLKNGFHVFAHYHSNKNRLLELQNENLSLIKADFRKTDQILSMVDECLAFQGHIDILVNNAGTIHSAPSFEEIAKKDFDEVFQVNLHAPFLLCQKVLPGMRKQRWGRIINISSIGVKFGGSPVSSHYTISKSALEALTATLNKVAAKDNILVNTVRAGVIDTELHRKVTNKNMEERTKLIPLGRMGTPQEVAETILFLASDKSDFVSGTTLTVSGGE